ncbi:lactose/L-arabinose transport system substrate-binding protein [Agrobacterium vitis]|nr:lactose/L-arabinose transport system substrate-binding protein [Agrobacterium vitis]MBE1437878.1 lactose/L-arabinose transport system substrate-binding protein [Agrobacterium vitis]
MNIFSKTKTMMALASTSLLATTAAMAGEVTIWCWDPNFNVAIMKEAGARYSAKHPGTTFNVVDFSKESVQQKLQTGLASGTADSLPDIVLIEDYGAQKYLQSFPGAFAALSGKVDYSGFAPYKVSLMTLDGKTYGMPFDAGVTGLYYRKDYLEQAGFKPEDMQNISWDRFIEIGKQVLAKTGKRMITQDSSDNGLTRVIMQSGGQWYFDDAGNLNVENNAPLKAAMQIQATMLKDGIVKRTSGWTDAVSAFTSGDVAAVISGVWITGTIKAQADQAGKWGVAPIPKLDVKGAVAASNLGGSSWYVLEKSKEKDEAIDFLNEIYGKDLEFYQKILTERGAVGSLLAARTGAAYNRPDPYFDGEKVWQDFSDWLAKVPSVNYGIFTAEVDTAVLANMPSFMKGTPIDDVMKAIASQAEGQMQ